VSAPAAATTGAAEASAAPTSAAAAEPAVEPTTGPAQTPSPQAGLAGLESPEVLRYPPIGDGDLDDGRALADLVAAVQRHHPHADTGALERAFQLGVRAHDGQSRKSGEPYFVHPVRVARILAQLGLDGCSIVAALLHDVVEDTELTVYDVTEQFGREVANIVDGVTKLGKGRYLSGQ